MAFQDMRRGLPSCQMFGGREDCVNAMHYIILIRFDRPVRLDHERVTLHHNFTFLREVDTDEIEIHMRPDEQYDRAFLEHMQEHLVRVLEPGSCFGDKAWLPIHSVSHSKEERGRRVADAQTHDNEDGSFGSCSPEQHGKRSIPGFLGLSGLGYRYPPPPRVSFWEPNESDIKSEVKLE